MMSTHSLFVAQLAYISHRKDGRASIYFKNCILVVM